jgi:hypothetical protein
LRPEVAIVCAGTTATGNRVWLAGKSSTENINSCEADSAETARVWTFSDPVDFSDIVVTPHIRPVLCQHLPAKGINFDLPLDFKPSSLKAQIKPADTGEQTSYG